MAECIFVICNEDADNMRYDVLRGWETYLSLMLSGSRLLTQLSSCHRISICGGGAGGQGQEPSSSSSSPAATAATSVAAAVAAPAGDTGSALQAAPIAHMQQQQQAKVHFFALPQLASAGSLRGPTAPADVLPAEYGALRAAISALPLRRGHGTSRGGVSEREWARGVAGVWQALMQRTPLAEQVALKAQRTRYAAAGGWPLAATSRS